jgi:hypothetical protein
MNGNPSAQTKIVHKPAAGADKVATNFVQNLLYTI